MKTTTDSAPWHDARAHTALPPQANAASFDASYMHKMARVAADETRAKTNGECVQKPPSPPRRAAPPLPPKILFGLVSPLAAGVSIRF